MGPTSDQARPSVLSAVLLPRTRTRPLSPPTARQPARLRRHPHRLRATLTAGLSIAGAAGPHFGKERRSARSVVRVPPRSDTARWWSPIPGPHGPWARVPPKVVHVPHVAEPFPPSQRSAPGAGRAWFIPAIPRDLLRHRVTSQILQGRASAHPPHPCRRHGSPFPESQRRPRRRLVDSCRRNHRRGVAGDFCGPWSSWPWSCSPAEAGSQGSSCPDIGPRQFNPRPHRRRRTQRSRHRPRRPR